MGLLAPTGKKAAVQREAAWLALRQRSIQSTRGGRGALVAGGPRPFDRAWLMRRLKVLERWAG